MSALWVHLWRWLRVGVLVRKEKDIHYRFVYRDFFLFYGELYLRDFSTLAVKIHLFCDRTCHVMMYSLVENLNVPCHWSLIV